MHEKYSSSQETKTNTFKVKDVDTEISLVLHVLLLYYAE